MKLNGFLMENGVARFPRVLFQKSVFGVYTEISERVQDARHLSDQHEAFYLKMSKILSKAKLEYSNVSWTSLLGPEILQHIKNNPKVYEFIKENLEDVEYPNTGTHGDFHPNNILVDFDQNFWIVDWENYNKTGSLVWDLYWFYGNWKRSSPKPVEDIVSIYQHSQKMNFKTRELLLIYALTKVRNDLQRHNRSIEAAIENFFQRISAIMDICQNSTEKIDRGMRNGNTQSSQKTSPYK